ncbi:SRPBCC domain-containing protein [Bacillus sp. DTU_2020_1000418_1_SI_GHA_SEK_038]|uniref:SRPBCC domain-containing protein n=1 Tax=Bacillus sp. DTU_2020_1000418_1_SI_GHA_SEK_038 TaxID=3077585 RepID=UPI0028EAA0D8|nr:SRPBCC domain-containing protein [Bacillus sp. DTU_2020_1000418_1_SI_GHA_SEK_038]WNS76668.1 SRPBCC domain-containing protein [Bacillus sp. DTU_2020_1000418_1_SI_GHA_SEK_038]
MTKRLIVKDKIKIQASSEKIWEVLINPKYVSQWDELPEDYPQEDMTLGSEVVWELPNGGKSITQIIKAEENKELIIALNVTNWIVKPSVGEVAYHYKIVNNGNHSVLEIEIGDFSLLQNGQMYYDASVEFASMAKIKIKDLAEGQNS